jgi:hypothetical protein
MLGVLLDQPSLFHAGQTDNTRIALPWDQVVSKSVLGSD